MSDGLEEDDDFDEGDAPSLPEMRRYIAGGLSIGDLASVFGVSRTAMTKAVEMLQPVARRGRSSLYTIADVAPMIVTPNIDIESYIRGLRPKDLPPSLQKQFWDAQAARQSYEEKAGELWHTHRVQSVIGTLVMLVRQRLVLATDQIDRMAPLSDEQRKLVRSTFDQTLSELQQAVIDAFKDYRGGGDRQDMFENGPDEPEKVSEDDGLDW
jgi:hypothetical protein